MVGRRYSSFGSVQRIGAEQVSRRTWEWSTRSLGSNPVSISMYRKSFIYPSLNPRLIQP